MSSNELRKPDIDLYLYELAKAYRKQNRHSMQVEIVIVGGASVLLNYSFRDSTTDIDAVLSAKAELLSAARVVQEKFGLPDGWVNADFSRTTSYSPRLVQHSKHYKTFCGVLNVRTVEGKYLFAMKLMSFRQYKKDISDLIGIAKELSEVGTPLTIAQIHLAVEDLYGNVEKLPEGALSMAEHILECEDLEALFYDTIEEERRAKRALLDAQRCYPDKVNDANANSFIEHFQGDSAIDESLE